VSRETAVRADSKESLLRAQDVQKARFGDRRREGVDTLPAMRSFLAALSGPKPVVIAAAPHAVVANVPRDDRMQPATP